DELLNRLSRMAQSTGYTSEFEQVAHYIDWVTSLPWEKRSEDILDLSHAKNILDKNHYDLTQIKERILEYLAVMRLRQSSQEPNSRNLGRSIPGIDVSPLKFMRAPILCFVGLVGTGKTTIAYSIAEAMGRKFGRIPFGGMGDPLDLRGQSRVRPDAEVGQVIKALRRCQTKNPVILLDEIDRTAEETRSDIMGVLVELLDPEQNMAFVDHYIDFPFDLSEVLFIATANNTTNISTAVLDRLEPIQMPSYTDEEKIAIGRDYVLPRIMEESGLTKDNLKIDEDVWGKIVRPLGFDAGVRTLERTLNGICRKVAKLIVEGKGRSFHLTPDNIKDFLPSW
ncbi:AAA family ATPase, partial [Candidatus Gottesmanbacteria bacterium]|nr:AAA family ATPase [Candidatus Gottesmanbacteria bacterium]